MLKVMLMVLVGMMAPLMALELSKVEKEFLNESGRQAEYEGEFLPVIETDNVCFLGKLTALRFIEWLQENPEGVVSLPTGKTPELFIAYLNYYRDHWNEPKVQQDLQQHGIKGETFPDTSNLKFVQLDEFFPIHPAHKNRFTAYVRKYYLSFLGLKPENVLDMDFHAKGIQTEEQAQEFAEKYEQKIREWGGIGFFLGGIGPDGHIAFNMSGSPFNSRTRLIHLNYASAAAAAGSLGGIEFSRDKGAVTIGLETITWNPDATIVIMAAGEMKAPVVADAIQQHQNPKYPGTVLHGHKGARFYLTRGASIHLKARKVEDVEKLNWNQFSPNLIDDIVNEIAMQENKRLIDLSERDYHRTERGKILRRKYPGKITALNRQVRDRLIKKFERGLHLPKRQTILHTSPHHDDVMLSYHPMLRDLLPENRNHFAYLTSGFNSVTNGYMLSVLNFRPVEQIPFYQKELKQNYAALMNRYLSAAEKGDQQTMDHIEWLIMLRNIEKIYHTNEMAALQEKVRWLRDEYFPNRIPGEKDIRQVQLLKGSMRESESDRMLAWAGVNLDAIHHLRANFYTGDYFNPMPTIEKDAKPMLEFYRDVKPDVVTVAFDPEGTGPDTHYKVLQVVVEGLRLAGNEIRPKIWGYRNVWHRFQVADANLMMPITDEDMATMNRSFLNCFSTQKTASFPPTNHDGPFSELSEKIQREQNTQLRVLLGDNYFAEHPDRRMRSAKGFVFIKEMNRDQFFESARELKSRIELK